MKGKFSSMFVKHPLSQTFVQCQRTLCPKAALKRYFSQITLQDKTISCIQDESIQGNFSPLSNKRCSSNLNFQNERRISYKTHLKPSTLNIVQAKHYSQRRPEAFIYPSEFNKPTHTIEAIVSNFNEKLSPGEIFNGSIDDICPRRKPIRSTQSRESSQDEINSNNSMEQAQSSIVILAGRVMSKREASKKLLFFDLTDTQGNTIQIATRINEWKGKNSFDSVLDIRRGDIVIVEGNVGRTKKGELSIFPRDLQLVSSCWHSLPDEYFGVLDKEVRFRNRYLDLIFNWQLKNEVFKVRTEVIRYIRRYLDEAGFLEVETPILDSKSGGAAAKPFLTHLNELNMDLRLRIAPELYLKQLIVGGFEKVYELGKIFRNEGMDLTHNPEFTMLEFYEAFADFEDLVTRTEDILSGVVKHTKGDYKFNVTSPEGEEIELNFKPPFNRLSYVGKIEEGIGRPLPKSTDPNSISILLDLCSKHNIDIGDAKSYASLVDKLAGKFVEPLSIQPTLVIDHPVEISPLAKPHLDRPEYTQRFELFVLGRELCNAYVELNDPDIQRQRFHEQLLVSSQEERHEKDDEFCHILEHGLPPTVGFGCGIDRLVMLLTNQSSIREVLFYPLMKSKNLEGKKKRASQEVVNGNNEDNSNHEKN